MDAVGVAMMSKITVKSCSELQAQALASEGGPSLRIELMAPSYVFWGVPKFVPNVSHSRSYLFQSCSKSVPICSRSLQGDGYDLFLVSPRTATWTDVERIWNAFGMDLGRILNGFGRSENRFETDLGRI